MKGKLGLGSVWAGLPIMFGLLKTLVVCWIILNSSSLYGQSQTPGIAPDKPNNQNTNSQHHPQKEQQVTKQESVVSTVVPAQPSEPPTASSACQQKHETSNLDWWMDHSVEIILALATLLLWWATRKLVIGADTTSRHQLRAYVGIQRIVIARNNPLVARVFIANTGKTMAKHVTVEIANMLHSVGTPQFKSGKQQPKITVMPNQICEFTQEIEIHPAAEFLSFYREGLGIIYVWGRIDYTDVFGKPHWTTFRFENGKHIHTEDIEEHWLTKYSEQGNETD